MNGLRDKCFAYGSQVYSAALLVVLLPAYLTQLGAEPFALMMLFSVAQGWLQIADCGYPLAVSREIAVARRESRREEIGALLGAMQLPMAAGMVLVAGAVLALGHLFLARDADGAFAHAGVVGMTVAAGAAALSLRWVSELYRAAMTGAEKFAVLAAVNVFFATARLGGALAVLSYIGGGFSAWLLCQMAVSLMETLALIALCRRHLNLRLGKGVRESARTLRALWPVAAHIAAASAIWISITQLDKLILSQMLSLRDYSAVGVAATIPAGLLILAVPLLQLSYPALVRLHRSDLRGEQTRLYLGFSALTCCLLFPAALVCIAFANEIVTVWFGGRLDTTSIEAIPLVPLYATGASFLALASMPYGLLNAAGELRGHVVASAILAACIAVGLIVGAITLGAFGAVAMWCASTGLFFLIWPQFVHRRHLEGRWWCWIATLAYFAVPLALLSYALKQLLPHPESLMLRIGSLAVSWVTLQVGALGLLWAWVRRRASGP